MKLEDVTLDDADVIIDYLEQFKPRFVSNIKQNYKKIEEYVISKNKLNK